MPGAKSWRTVVGIGMIWPGLLSLGIIFMPESPRSDIFYVYDDSA